MKADTNSIIHLITSLNKHSCSISVIYWDCLHRLSGEMDARKKLKCKLLTSEYALKYSTKMTEL